MRYLIAVAAVTAALAAPAMAALPNATALSSIDSVGRWIATSRSLLASACISSALFTCPFIRKVNCTDVGD